MEDIRFVTRQQWRAQPSSFVPTMNPPAKMIMFGFPQQQYAPKGKPWLGSRPSYESAVSEIKFIQKMDLKKYPDIKYNFLIAPDGIVFEGRGWDKVPTLPSKYRIFSHLSYYIMFIGDFINEPPGDEYYIARNKLLQFGVRHNYLCKRFLLYTLNSNIKSPNEAYDFNKRSLTGSKF
ncbi:peptidoglycan recognition protein 1-like [Macrosteles quadrilineatus]|uniref:peptidoglycan recognition protein 1-like n=1 Tax=Macrosteles quadrilineatus TaxID=74068 RepID=UPI0023E1085A|nr:peptidoglycan recognition protein 1-like [Macrosteles quadrilineatus]XP_054260388.1 peptidoglycan recognition protein 1-like [Macrosteles quadrilineatus]